jgi:hypothetical protein
MGDVKVAITGDNTGLIAALTEAKAAVTEGSEQMAASFEGVAAAAEMINKALVAVTAVLAGGAAFKEAIASVVDLNVQSAQLGRQFGISATEAGVLKAALEETHVTQDQFSAAGVKITRMLNTNEGAFKALGVATRDASGNFRPLADIVIDTNTALMKYKEGTDRNIEAQKVYGRSAQEVAATFRVTAQAISAAKESVTDLGLTVTKESEAMTSQYRDSLVRVNATLMGIENAIGQAVIPTLTNLGNWFRSVGPQVIETFRVALEGLTTIFSAVADSVKTLWSAVTDLGSVMGSNFHEMFGGESLSAMELFVNAIKVVEVAFIGLRTGVETVVQFVRNKMEEWETWTDSWAHVMDRALHLDWKGVKQAWADGNAAIEAQEQKSMERLVAITEKSAADMDKAIMKAMGQQSQGTPTDAPPGGQGASGQDQNKNQMAALEADLEAFKANLAAKSTAAGAYHELSLEEEKTYWETVLQRSNLSEANRLAIEKKVAGEDVQIWKDAAQGKLAVMKTEETEAGNNLKKRLQMEEQYAAQLKATYPDDVKAYEAAQRQILQTKQQIIAQERQLDNIRLQSIRDEQLGEIAAKEATAKHELDLKKITNEKYIQLEQQLEAQKYAIEQEANAAELSLINPNTDPVAYATKMAQIETLARAHANTMIAIARQSDAEQISLTKSVTDAMSRGFSTAFQGIINGTMTMGQAFTKVLQSMLQSVVQFIAQWAAKNLAAHAAKMAQSKEEINADAAGAAVGGAKSAAQVPYIGWALAIGAAASIFAAMSGYKSAAGGFDVPAGMNPMTQLHSEEMVLPQAQANVIRDMAESGDAGGTQSGGDAHIHLHGTRSGSIFMAQQDDLVAAIKSAHRAGKFGRGTGGGVYG